MEGEEGEDVMARLESGLGRRWTADDAARVIGWIEGQVETSLGPTALDLIRSHFAEMISDEPEYQEIVFCAIKHDLETLRANNEFDTETDIDELASDIFDEAREMYFNPEEEEDDDDLDFSDGETADDDDVGTGTGLIFQEGILESLNEVVIRVGGEDQICVVCQDGLHQEQSAVSIQGCGHVYHLDCLKRWLQFKDFCPLCKTKVGQRQQDDEGVHKK